MCSGCRKVGERERMIEVDGHAVMMHVSVYECPKRAEIPKTDVFFNWRAWKGETSGRLPGLDFYDGKGVSAIRPPAQYNIWRRGVEREESIGRRCLSEDE